AWGTFAEGGAWQSEFGAPSGEKFTQVVTAYDGREGRVTLALTDQGTVVAHTQGDLHNSGGVQNIPDAVANADIVDISGISGGAAAAVAADGHVFVWGNPDWQVVQDFSGFSNAKEVALSGARHLGVVV